MEKNNVIAFCAFIILVGKKQIPEFGCYEYKNEREVLIKFERKKSIKELLGNFFEDKTKMKTPCFPVT